MAFAGEWDVLEEPNNKVVGPCGVLGGGENARTVVSPSMVNGLVADYDVFNTSGLVVDGSNRVQLVSDSSGNSAENVLALNGAIGNGATAPSSAALQITGSIDLRCRVAPATWTPAAFQALVSKWTTAGNQRSYGLRINTDGTLGLIRSTDGLNADVLVDSTLPVTALPFQVLWVRVTWDASSGDVVFYTSNDGVTWTQLGSVVSSVTTPTFSSTALAGVGQLVGSASNLFVGKVFRAQIYDGIDGTLAFDANFTTAAKLATSFTESSVNAATVTINTTGQHGARICGARDLVNMTAANQPIRLPWSGTNYGYLNGVSGNYFSAPDSAAVSVTGDLDLRVHTSLVLWTGSSQRLLSKWQSGQRSYVFSVGASGNLVLGVSSDGTAAEVPTSTATLTVSANESLWIRATRVSATGVVQFFTSTDGLNWTQLGTNVSSTAGNIFDGTSALSVGDPSANMPTGRVFRAQVYNGIDGTLAFDFNPAAYVSGTTFVDQSVNAATITLNGGSVIVNNSMLYFDGTNDSLKAAAFAYAQPCTVYFLGSQVTWTASDRLYSGGTTLSNTVLQRTSSPIVAFTGGAATPVGNISTLSIGTRGVLTHVFNGASSLGRLNMESYSLVDGGSVSANGFTLAAIEAGSSAFGNITFTRALLYSGAHDEATQRRTIRYLMGQGGVS